MRSQNFQRIKQRGFISYSRKKDIWQWQLVIFEEDHVLDKLDKHKIICYA